MPAFNFQSRFATKVLDGTKLQTIRAERKDKRPHAKVGDTLSLYTGMRTKQCLLLRTARCLDILDIYINPAGFYLFRGDQPIALKTKRPDLDKFAIADGFESWEDLCQWLQSNHQVALIGSVIRWAPI